MTILTLNFVKLITITISIIKTITTITWLPSVMGGSRSRQPRQLRRPFSSKGTFQGDNQNAFDRWSCVRLKRKNEVSLWAAKTANLFNCSCPSYTPPTSCLIAPTLPTACLSVRTCSIPPPRNSSQGRNQGTRLSNQIPPPPPPKSTEMCGLFLPKQQKDTSRPNISSLTLSSMFFHLISNSKHIKIATSSTGQLYLLPLNFNFCFIFDGSIFFRQIKISSFTMCVKIGLSLSFVRTSLAVN